MKQPHANVPGVSWNAMLRAKPVPNASADVTQARDQEMRIAVPRRRPAYLVPPLSWFVRPAPTRTVVLDHMGRQIWQLCDGNRTVEDIVETFSFRQRLSFHEARVSTTAYLKLMAERGALVIVMSQ